MLLNVCEITPGYQSDYMNMPLGKEEYYSAKLIWPVFGFTVHAFFTVVVHPSALLSHGVCG